MISPFHTPADRLLAQLHHVPIAVERELGRADDLGRDRFAGLFAADQGIGARKLLQLFLAVLILCRNRERGSQRRGKHGESSLHGRCS